MTDKPQGVRRMRSIVFAAHFLGLTSTVFAADLTITDPVIGPQRYFPREDGRDSHETLLQKHRTFATHCLAHRVPVPTNHPSDPSYTGSEYGLGKPSYYGFTPPRGIDDPFGRPVLPYCR